MGKSLDGRSWHAISGQLGRQRKSRGDCESEDARRNLYNMDAVFVSAGIFLTIRPHTLPSGQCVRPVTNKPGEMSVKVKKIEASKLDASIGPSGET